MGHDKDLDLEPTIKWLAGIIDGDGIALSNATMFLTAIITREFQHLAIYSMDSTRNKIRPQIKILDVLKMLYQQCKHKERTILTKKVVKNYFLAVNTLFFRSVISCGKPVIAPL